MIWEREGLPLALGFHKRLLERVSYCTFNVIALEFDSICTQLPEQIRMYCFHWEMIISFNSIIGKLYGSNLFSAWMG